MLITHLRRSKNKLVRAFKYGNLRINHIISNNSLALQVWLVLLKIYDKWFNENKIMNLIDETIKTFTTVEGKEKSTLRNAILRCREVNLISPDEYFLYNFANLTEEERHKFVGNHEKVALCFEIKNNSTWMLFISKYQTYLKFKDFYHREIIEISSIENKNDFFKFFEKHDRGILKPADSSLGRGVTLLDKSQAVNLWNDKLSSEIASGASFILEEYIRQSEKMALFNPDSVNTVRLATYRLHDETIFLFAALRTGIKGQIVDNGGAGGLTATIDLETGIVISNARNRFGKFFEKHPDSNVVFKGFQLPDWEKLRQLGKALSLVEPEQLYVGWDLAHTDNGWVMIEGNNRGQFVLTQRSSLVGLRDKINATFYQTLKERAKA
jgi:hypothetical protein